MSLNTIIQNFYQWEKNTPDKVFLRQPKGQHWKTITYSEAGQIARSIATALQSKGLNKGDHVGILSKNCCHWILADLAIMMGRYVSVPFYASLPKNQLEEVIKLSDIKLLFVGKLDHWGNKSEAIPDEVDVIKFPRYENNAEITNGDNWDDLVASSKPLEGNPSSELDDLWTIKFTSGTTGTPKGVMHIHRTPAQIMKDEDETNWIGMSKMKDARFLSFLPLNHVGERLGVEVPCLYAGGTISFVESLDTFAQNIVDTQPTLLFAVPRIWTKFYQGVISKMPPKKIDLMLKIPIVSGIFKRKIRAALGLRDVQIAATGAAITPEYLKKWYKKLGIHLVEAYGMTEVCGSMANGPDLNTPPDSVGKVIPKGEIKIHPETGEILMKTPYMMTGYYKDQEKTDEVLINGWMHSGDRGTIDDHGYVRVIGRVKDAFKTSKGSYITPNPMEEEISKNDYVEQCCVVGLGIPQPICLVNLSESGQNCESDRVTDSLKSQLTDLNNRLAGYQRISTIVINNTHWTEANSILTPTLKVKRAKVDEHYRSNYLSWHESSEQIIWE